MLGYFDKKTSPLSAYMPSRDVIDFTAQVKRDYDTGVQIINKPWIELNDRSVIDDENRGQRLFNAFVDENVEDPNEAWKWRGTRSKARNKAIAMHAQIAAGFLRGHFTAQNENDEIDKGFSEVMDDVIEWMCLPTVSNYQSSFLQIVFGMETNPVTFLGAEFCEVYQTIKEKTESGKYTKKEILDEVLSGFKCPIFSSSQVLITNAYERNIQKQRAIIKRRYCERQELEAKYGQHENWGFVQEGIKSIYSEEDGLFYDIKDEEHPTLVAEETYLDRRNDVEVCFINGIYMGEGAPEDNPIKHRDNRNAPKYNVIPFGFHRIGEHFFYYKSMMNAMTWDSMLDDTVTELEVNAAILENAMPIAVTGSDKIDSEVIFPNAVVTFEDKDTKINPLLPPRRAGSLLQVLEKNDESMSDASVNETISGQLPSASQKAYSVAQAQANSKKLIGGIGKSLAESLTQYFDLVKDIAINNVTAAEVEELLGGGIKLKYKTFMLENKPSGGKMVNKKVKFDPNLIGREMTPDELKYENLKLLEESGYPHTKNSIRLVNPELFAKYKYLSRIDIEEMFVKNAEYWQPLLMNLKATLAQDPFTDQEALTRKLMYSIFQSEGDSLVKQQQPQIPGLPQGVGQPMKPAMAVPGIKGNQIQ